MDLLVEFFAWLMDGCHAWCPNWWADIVIFTFLTKVLQFPISLWCQINSLKMVSLMPEEIRIKIDHYGDKDTIGEMTAALYRREHYHPLLTLVPLALNILFLMAFVKVIYGLGDTVGVSASFTTNLHLKVSDIPVRDGGLAWLMPLLAGVAAWLLGYAQNILNPLQREQTRAQQLVTNGISIAISLFLGLFVAAGVGLYWATSNLFSILVQVCENICIPPKKHVDYRVLRRAQAEWKRFEISLKKGVVSKEDRAREKMDYKRFFSVANKHVVFYAEGGGYYKYFQSIIEWLLEHSNIVIHYVTNDPQDAIFSQTAHLSPQASRIRPYYIGPIKIIPLMMKMDADIVVMTTPDLNAFHIKRSYVKKDVEYIYVDHGPTSVHMCYRKGAFDHFDTIMCNGPFQVAEHRATEKLYHLKAKNLVESGYPLLDMWARKEQEGALPLTSSHRIMIANSHQKDNIFDSCLDELINSIVLRSSSPSSLSIVLRPHPQYVRRFPARWQAIKEKHEGLSTSTSSLTFICEDDFSKPSTMDQSDVLITDWSGIAYEFAYQTRRPTLFVNTPMKVVNPDWEKLGIVPTDIWFRDEVGVSIEMSDVASRAGHYLADLLANRARFVAQIDKLFAENFFNPGHAGAVAGSYILDALLSKQKQSSTHVHHALN